MDERPSILMVEDNVGDVVLLREYLAECRFDCEIRECRLLSEALQALKDGTYHIILLDLILPDSKGLTTFEAVHRRSPNVPIVILTGFADEELACQAVKAGAQDYLPKNDINGTQLSRTIRYAIERKRAQQSLHQAKEAAEAANKAKDRFLAALSHELRTPLTPVLAQVQFLERDSSLGPELREAMAMIRRNIELEARLIDDLLDLSRVASGKMELRPQLVDLHPLVTHSLQFCQEEAAAKGLAVKCQLLATETTLRADPDRLLQVLWNLLSNAVKFTPPGGGVTITTANPSAGYVRVTVSDSGIGIDPQLLPRIFEPFEQGGRTVTRHFGGLGLGLAITRSIINLHEGTLSAASDGNGQGATFTVDLQNVSAEVHIASQRMQAPSATRSLRILLVEDHENTAKVMSLLLGSCGHSVLHTRSIEDGFSTAMAENPDLLISDLGLPDGSGLELMRRLRHERPGIKGIVISGYGTSDDIRDSLRAGFARHLTKPFSDRALLDAIVKVTLGSVVATAP